MKINYQTYSNHEALSQVYFLIEVKHFQVMSLSNNDYCWVAERIAAVQKQSQCTTIIYK